MVFTAWAHFLCKLRTVFIIGAQSLSFLCLSLLTASGALADWCAPQPPPWPQLHNHQQLSPCICPPACLWRKRDSAGLHSAQIPPSAESVNTQAHQLLCKHAAIPTTWEFIHKRDSGSLDVFRLRHALAHRDISGTSQSFRANSHFTETNPQWTFEEFKSELVQWLGFYIVESEKSLCCCHSRLRLSEMGAWLELAAHPS